MSVTLKNAWPGEEPQRTADCTDLCATRSASTNQITTSGYSYDAAGNLIGDGYNTYQWDAESHLTAVYRSGGVVSLNTYNALGQRVEDMTSTSTTDEAYGSVGELLLRYTGDSNSRSFVPFNGRILAEYYCGGMIFDHPDAIGSVTTGTDCTGSLANERLFYPFGEFLNGYSMPNLGMHMEFAQLPDYDPEIDQYNTLYRHYTTTGRWLSPDPNNAGADPSDPQTWNMYAYAGNNPTTNTDPTGELYCGPADENGTMPCVLDQDYFNNPDQYQGYTYYQSNYPQEQNEPNGQQEPGAQSPDLDPIDLGLLAYGGVNVVRGVVDAGASLINMVKGAFTSETPVIQTLGIASLWASADEVVSKAVATIGNQSMRVASKEVAEAAAEKFVGPGAKTITDRSTGQVVGKISADGTKVYRTTSVGKAEPYINLENKSTGGNLHVRW